ncbi:hypothetical protein [Mycobacteroides abscessus]|uniref:hypothetical protein n=1 Tax=Mycobacteroides abscessus TaxID=36809 RepID=UPI000AC68977|nr:hypothetical protein [Mycobacteroides abscessus]
MIAKSLVTVTAFCTVMLCAGSFAADPAFRFNVRPVVLGTLLRQPAADMPTPEQLSSVLYGIADPSVAFFYKGDLVEDGVGGFEGAVADGGIQIAALKNELPLDFVVSDIEPVKPGKVRATVRVTGPQLKGVTKRLTFVDQDGWRLQHASAMSLLQATSSAQRG